MIRMLFASTAAVVITATQSLADVSFEQCGCQRILSDGLFRVKSEFNSKDYEEYAFRFFCSASESVAIDSLKKQSQLGFSIPETLNLSFDALNAEESLRSWRAAECETNERKVGLEELRTYFERVADVAVLDAANQCFQTCVAGQGGLFCSLNDVNDELSILSVSWTPSNNNLQAPKITGGEIVGGEIVRSSFGASPISEGVEILPLGVSATIRRNDPSQPISVVVRTDNGICEQVSDEVKAKYTLSVSARVSGVKREPVSQSFRQSLGDSGSCTEGWTQRDFLQCIQGDEITGIIGPLIHSQNNNGTASYTRDGQAAGKPACAMFHFGYSDRGREWTGNCKGNGWIDAEFVMNGYKRVPVNVGPYSEQREIELEFNAPSILSFDASSIGLGVENSTWTYIASVDKIVGGVVQYSAQLTEAVPRFQDVQTSIAPNGVLTVQIVPAE